MTEPLDILNHEHRIIKQGLRGLDGMCQRLESGQQIPSEAVAQILDFIRTFADRCHQMKEEMHLFPALQQHGVPREGGCLGVLLHEHDMGRGLIAELSRAAQSYKDGDAEAGRRLSKRRAATLIC
jgi:hemerythrin-like domain-containing protein